MRLFRRSEPIDPDITLFTEYLGRALGPPEQLAVEERVRTDEEFFAKVAPLIKARLVMAERRALYGPTPAGAWQGTVATGKWSRRVRWTVGVAATLAFAFIGVGYYANVILPRQERNQDVRDTLLQRAPSGWSNHGPMVETKPGETRVAVTERNSRVIVRGESRFKYLASPPGAYAGFMWASLDGEAAIDVSPEEGLVQVKTWAGRVRLDKGSYAIRCAPGCSAMLVTVGAGLATMVSDTTKPGVVLQSGETGQVPKNGVPEKAGNGGKDWPPLATAAEKEMPAIRGGAQQTGKTKAVP